MYHEYVCVCVYEYYRSVVSRQLKGQPFPFFSLLPKVEGEDPSLLFRGTKSFPLIRLRKNQTALITSWLFFFPIQVYFLFPLYPPPQKPLYKLP